MSSTMERFLAIGLSEQKAKETLKNDNLTKTLLDVLQEVENAKGDIAELGPILYQLASKIKPQIKELFPVLIPYIISKQIDSVLRLEAGLSYLLNNASKTIDKLELEKACGIGIVITPEDVESAVEKAMLKYKHEILEKRYRFNTGPLLQDIRNVLQWADFKDVKNEIDIQMLDMLGPKTEEDLLPPSSKKLKDQKSSKKQDGTKQVKIDKSGKSQEVLTIDDMISKLQLHKPGENFQTDGYVITSNTNNLLQHHLKATEGKVRTRFPPEPNGILHIGHAKAININFGYAAHHDGVCFLRFDDTNPEKEEEQFFHGIMDMVSWLGYKPYKITHSSDYFDQLYELAIKLIVNGHAYVCHQSQKEMQGHNPPPSPYRNRSVEENLKLFQDMKNGVMAEGECTLRMKITLEEGKQDPVAYRIKYVPHPKAGDKWCIYPTYDYTHCLCDSIENITHSLCTKEFQSRRSSYYWLCNALDIYCPVQWEYGRLNMNYTVVSKRKISKLIETGVVKDWDDPRLFTLTALRRRGYPPEAINRFCAQIGVTGAQSIVDPGMLEASVRDVLNVTAPRTMVVLDPLEIEIVEGYEGETGFTVPDFPSGQTSDSHSVAFSKFLFIEADDYREEGDKDYKRFTMTQPVGLRYTPYLIKFVGSEYKPGTQEPYKLKVRAVKLTEDNKPRAFVHWVAKPVEITVNLYSKLFNHKNPEDPEEVPNGYLSDINSDSKVVKQAYADKHLLEAVKPFKQFQFERLGYFSVDPDTSTDRVIFNRTALLRDSGKQ